jgi:2-polyprenyl-3-methyl-5-hydroxy-6-metoxy-1,4-benzoquinol methylase
MSFDESEIWDRKYRDGSHGLRDPDPLLPYAFQEFVQPLFPSGGTALDVAGGLGRHSIFLARQGWKVTLVDSSSVGVAQARENARELGSLINYKVTDLAQSPWEVSIYDVVIVFFYLERRILPHLIEAIRPGGFLIYKSYTHMAPKFGKGPTDPMHLLKENELLHAFPGVTVLHYLETIQHSGTAELVARKKA